MRPTAFDDRTVTLAGSPEQLGRLSELLASPTRLAMLAELRKAAPDPLNINELGRRVGVDASPVRGHLEVLLKEGLVDEVRGRARERLFTTRLTDAVLTLKGVERVAAEGRGPPPRAVVKLQRKLEDLDRDAAKLAAKAARVRTEIEKEWGRVPKPNGEAR